MSDLGSLLVEHFSVDSVDLEKAKSFQQKQGGRLERILVSLGSISEDSLPDIYASYLGLPILEIEDLDQFKPVNNLAEEDQQFLQSHGWLVTQIDAQNWHFLTTNPLNIEVNQWINQKNVLATIQITREEDFTALSAQLLPDSEEGAVQVSADEEERLKELAGEAPTINLLNSLISRGLRQNASDMHLEPYKGRYRCRYRIDGVLQSAEYLSPKMELPITTRLKILSGMDIAERRRPQDGKIEMRIANQELDIRVSALPLNDGESMVLRFLKKESVRYDMSTLELAKSVEELVREDLSNTSGVILLTGPTGSGKTTTLYTFLNHLNKEGVKIISLEDPVEYQLEGINQVQVNSEIGYDFASGLRSIVRQDPDIIMLGEIRDPETAKIALQSALTGHLVLSTVHTNDAATAYTRLLDLGTEEFLLNAALLSVIAQRLVRRVCTECATPVTDIDAWLDHYHLTDVVKSMDIAEYKPVEAVGCANCSGSGYSGRMAITEYMRCDDHIMELPKDESFVTKARAVNRDLGRRNLFEDGIFKVMQGKTTVEEVMRVAGNG